MTNSPALTTTIEQSSTPDTAQPIQFSTGQFDNTKFNSLALKLTKYLKKAKGTITKGQKNTLKTSLVQANYLVTFHKEAQEKIHQLTKQNTQLKNSLHAHQKTASEAPPLSHKTKQSIPISKTKPHINKALHSNTTILPRKAPLLPTPQYKPINIPFPPAPTHTSSRRPCKTPLLQFPYHTLTNKPRKASLPPTPTHPRLTRTIKAPLLPTPTNTLHFRSHNAPFLPTLAHALIIRPYKTPLLPTPINYTCSDRPKHRAHINHNHSQRL